MSQLPEKPSPNQFLVEIVKNKIDSYLSSIKVQKSL